MKARKILGNILTCLGGILLFGGLLAWFLPRWENQQVQLVINSFRTPSGNLFLQWINNGMTFAMDSCTTVLVLGAVLLLIGILLTSSVRTEASAQPAPAARPAAHAAPVAAAAAVAAAPQINPFARVQTGATAESNPFAKYLAPDSVPKRTAPRGEEAQPEAAAVIEPAAAAQPALIEAADDADETKVYRLAAETEAPASDAEDEPVLFALVDDDDDDDDDDDVLFESAAETAPVDASGELYYPLQPDEHETFPLLTDDEEDTEPAAAEMLEEAMEETAETNLYETAFYAPEPEPAAEEALWEAPQEETAAEEAPAEEEETFIGEVPATEEVAAAEDEAPAAEETAAAEEDTPCAAMPEPMPDPQPTPALRPVIRSTFKKSTASQSADAPSSTRNTASESAGLRPAPRIKSTMGQKR
jgi:hypothetical protein